MKKILTPTAPKSTEAKRVGAIFHRRPETKWSVKEIEKYMLIHPVQEDDLALLERYYAQNWPPWRGHNILRTDLMTLLGNWQGEVDRARTWADQHKPKQPRKVVPFPTPPEQAMTEAERAQAAAEFEAITGRKPKLSL